MGSVGSASAWKLLLALESMKVECGRCPGVCLALSKPIYENLYFVGWGGGE